MGTTTDDDRRILVGTDSGIYLSLDAGASFRRVSSHPVAAVAYDWQNWRDAVALTTDGTLLRSADGGLTW